MLLRNVVTFAATEAGEHAEGGIAALGLNLGSLLIQLATFALVFFILKKFAFGKILGALEERRKTIEESLKNAEAIERRNEQNQAETEKLLTKARKQADEVIAKAHEESGVILQQAEERAAKRTEQMVADAKSRLESDILSARNQLKKELLVLVADASAAIVEEKVDTEKDRQLLEKAISRSTR